MAQSVDTQAQQYGPVGSRRFGYQGEGVGVTHQREVGVGLLNEKNGDSLLSFISNLRPMILRGSETLDWIHL